MGRQLRSGYRLSAATLASILTGWYELDGCDFRILERERLQTIASCLLRKHSSKGKS
jgi:hypothetical protein